jgi:hypothetical protein
VRLEGFGQLKKSNDTENRTRDLLVCSIMPQPIIYRLPRPSSVNILIEVEILILHISAPLLATIRRHSQQCKGTISSMPLFEHRLLLKCHEGTYRNYDRIINTAKTSYVYQKQLVPIS